MSKTVTWKTVEPLAERSWSGCLLSQDQEDLANDQPGQRCIWLCGNTAAETARVMGSLQRTQNSFYYRSNKNAPVPSQASSLLLYQPRVRSLFSSLWEEEVRRRRERTAAPFPDQSLPICSWPKLQEGEVSTVSQVWSLSYCTEHFNYWMESISYHLKWLSNYYLKVTRAVLGTGFSVRDKEKN